jgi:hypothetical protein
MYTCKTPVLFLVFNRPNTTAKVFEQIRLAKPSKLYIAADGPRVSVPSDIEKCRQVRDIASNVDWPCEVKTLFREQNLGCKKAVSSAITWFFENEEEGIILEDDTLPHPTFFRFCDELLDKYRDDRRVMMISGDNFQFGQKRTSYSYYFSRYNHIWGWASWRRAWKYYDVDMKLWPEVRDSSWLNDVFEYPRDAKYWEDVLQRVYLASVDTWDAQWTFACWLHSGLTILPNASLVSNIGFNVEATHTKYKDNPISNIPVEAMKFPIAHPDIILRDAWADDFTQKIVFNPSILYNLSQKIKKYFVKILHEQ